MRNVVLDLERTITVVSNGSSRQVTFLLESLEETDIGWACHYSLSSIETGKRKIFGEDAIHALQLCLRHVERVLRHGNEELGWKVKWFSESDVGGFLRTGE